MFEYHTFLQNPEKTMFGGILLGFAGYLLARHFLKFRQSVLDTVAIAFPVAISIQTIGCFFYGCCFGTASNLPWSVQYPVMTLPHYHQFESGLLTYTDLHSLPVHPVQLYLTVGGLLVAFLVFKLRKYWKAPGSLLLSSAILFASLRFILEFFRDSLSNKTGGEMLWIFKQVQWQYLVFGMLMAMILLWREKTVKVKPVAVTVELPGLNTRIGFLFFLL
ncbi:MAG: prolipoprotein diacylglyceryl transferase, partial [Bacteroidia bacterium]|nr:prolipoprotein diacylglyceryl transferase [Bacteroidia bacterium]